MRQLIFLFVILLFICSCENKIGTNNYNTIVDTQSRTVINGNDPISVKVLQDTYNKVFCAGFDIGSKECQKNIDIIKNNSETGYYDLSTISEKNKYLINSVSIESINYRVYYETPRHPRNPFERLEVSGAIMYPNGIKIPRGVILYFHPTAFDNQNVPSGNMTIANKRTNEDLIYAAIYASQGYVVILPDYIGQGIDYARVHPYVLYPQVSFDTGVALLQQTESLIRSRYSEIKRDEHIKLFSVGYSEGGAYSIWFSKCAQNIYDCPEAGALIPDFYDYTASVGMDGAYDLTNVVEPFLFSDVGIKEGVYNNDYHIYSPLITNGAKSGLSILAMISYLTYSKNPYNSMLAQAFDNDFYEMNCHKDTQQDKCNVNGEHINLLKAINKFSVIESSFIPNLLYSAMQKNYFDHAKHAYLPDGPASLLTSRKNNIDALINPDVFKISSDFTDTLKRADIANWQTKKPIYLISLKNDSVVSVNNTTNFESNLKSNDFLRVYYLDNATLHANIKNVPDALKYFEEIDHVKGETYNNLFALHYINQCVENNGVCPSKK